MTLGYFDFQGSTQAGVPSQSAFLTAASQPLTPLMESPETDLQDIQATSRGPSRQSGISGTTLNPGENAGLDVSPRMTDEPEPLPDSSAPAPDTATNNDSQATAPSMQPQRRKVDEALCPMPVSFFMRNRYGQRYYLSTDLEIKNNELKEITMIPAKGALPYRPLEIEGWRKYVHPEGQVYWRHSKGTRTYYTNTYLYDHSSLQDIQEAVQYVERELSGHPDLRGKSIEIGLEIYTESGTEKEAKKFPCYYMCDSESREIFWLVECSIDWAVEEENFPVYDPEHLRHLLKRSYWQHVEMFPHDKPLRDETLKKLVAVLSYHLYDRETSRTSNAPYGADDLHRFVELFRNIHITNDSVSHYDMVKVARMKALLCADQFRHYHGTKWARLDSNRSVHKDIAVAKHDHSWWFYLTSWLLFFSPSIYIKRLDEMWLDEKINHQPWRKFIHELQEDWTASITPSTVILGANVGFLAIQSVDQGGEMVPHRSAGQIISYISTLLTIGNIIACTVLARQHRPSLHRHAEDALNYLARRANEKWQAELLAIVLSIPTAFFVWGLLAFSAAILWDCFNDSSISTRAAVGSASLFTAVLITLVILNGKFKRATFFHSIPTQMRQHLMKVPLRKLTMPLRKLTNMRAATRSRSFAGTAAIPLSEIPATGPYSA
ncbi:hypothetical protein BN946_scf184569.g23 [Trametes cinnabarina]|uniref:WW domain-containing protein n=1 Tax=Pycnoporus cinnabarinus TaxID=5643 RepID=A0A060S7Z0_PYCCI|nr:hypothetical protein BN946_scf184569.g23 [Trametes cinnabarina]